MTRGRRTPVCIRQRVCLASSDLLHVHLALAGTHLNDCYYRYSRCSIILQRNKLSTDGVQYKALDGVFANLWWDLAVDQYTFYWDLLNHKSEESSQWQAISTFARGIAGGNGISRAAYIYDNVNLPEVQQWSQTVCNLFLLARDLQALLK